MIPPERIVLQAETLGYLLSLAVGVSLPDETLVLIGLLDGARGHGRALRLIQTIKQTHIPTI